MEGMWKLVHFSFPSLALFRIGSLSNAGPVGPGDHMAKQQALHLICMRISGNIDDWYCMA